MRKGISAINVFININNKKILNDVSLELSEADISVIAGHNGAGKSTLLKVLAKVLSPDTGKVLYHNDNFSIHSSFVFQKPVFLNRSVKDNLLYSLSCDKNQINANESIIFKYLDELNLLHLYNSPAKKLSSGEQQMIAFIRSVITKPSVLFLDEPTSSLDQKNKKYINNTLLELSKETKIIITSQSEDQTRLFTDKPILMQNGMII